MFVKHQAAIDQAKAVGASRDVWGDPAKPKLPCDDMSTFKIEHCKTCLERESCGSEKE